MQCQTLSVARPQFHRNFNDYLSELTTRTAFDILNFLHIFRDKTNSILPLSPDGGSMQKRLFVQVLIVCALVMLFATNAMTARLQNGQFAEAWVEYEKEFNDYMQDYIAEKTKGLQYTKKKKLLPKKEFKKKVKEFESVKKTYASVKQKSEAIRSSLKAIDKNFNSDGMVIDGRLKTFGKQSKGLLKAKKSYLKILKKLKRAEEIDKKEVKVPARAIDAITDNIQDVYNMAKNAESNPQTPEEFMAMDKKNSIVGLQNSISMMKHCLAKVKKNPTLKTWTDKKLMPDACRDMQLMLGGFKKDKQFKNADKLWSRFNVYERQMAGMIKKNIRKPADEKKAIMDAYNIIKKDLKIVEKNFTSYKKTIKYKG